MKIIKSILEFIVIIILIIFLFMKDSLIEKIPNNEVTNTISYIIFILVVISFIWDAYKAIKNKKYTTTILIVITDVVIIVSATAILLIGYKSLNVTDINIIIDNNLAISRNSIFFSLGLFFNSVFKSERFID